MLTWKPPGIKTPYLILFWQRVLLKVHIAQRVSPSLGIPYAKPSTPFVVASSTDILGRIVVRLIVPTNFADNRCRQREYGCSQTVDRSVQGGGAAARQGDSRQDVDWPRSCTPHQHRPVLASCADRYVTTYAQWLATVLSCACMLG